MSYKINLYFYRARQILELGYDFSPLCDRWNCSFLHGCGQSFSHIVYRSDEQHHSSVQELSEYLEETGTTCDINALIPLVPMLALDKCLPNVDPDVVVVKYPALDDIFIRTKEGKIINADSFGAFLWFHKHYEKELRAKFNEVIK